MRWKKQSTIADLENRQPTYALNRRDLFCHYDICHYDIYHSNSGWQIEIRKYFTVYI